MQFGGIGNSAMRRSSRSGGRRRAPGVLKRTACSGSGRFPLHPNSQARPCWSVVFGDALRELAEDALPHRADLHPGAPRLALPILYGRRNELPINVSGAGRG